MSDYAFLKTRGRVKTEFNETGLMLVVLAPCVATKPPYTFEGKMVALLTREMVFRGVCLFNESIRKKINKKGKSKENCHSTRRATHTSTPTRSADSYNNEFPLGFPSIHLYDVERIRAQIPQNQVSSFLVPVMKLIFPSNGGKRKKEEKKRVCSRMFGMLHNSVVKMKNFRTEKPT